jgi:hypothetical protein
MVINTKKYISGLLMGATLFCGFGIIKTQAFNSHESDLFISNVNIPVTTKPGSLPGFIYDGLNNPNSKETVGSGGDIKNADEKFIEILANFIEQLLSVVGLITIMMIMYGALLIITAGDSDDKKNKGWAAIKYAVIGLLLALSSYAIIQIAISIPAQLLKNR